MNRFKRFIWGLFGREFWTQEELDGADILYADWESRMRALFEESDMIGKNVLAINEATLIDALSEYFDVMLEAESVHIAAIAVVDDVDLNLNLILVANDV